jgi:hypothetical protein
VGSSVGDELRQFWLPGINQVAGKPRQTLIGLLGSQQYQIYVPTTEHFAQLDFQDWALVASAFASDAAKAAMASLESIETAQAEERGQGWTAIRTYYAGFFAAHAIQRMLGRAVIQVDVPAASAVDAVANLFGMAASGSFSEGMYVLHADAAAKTVTLKKWRAKGGSHVCLWVQLVAQLREVITALLASRHATSVATAVATKLTEIEQVLTDRGSTVRGSWLSTIRNRVNYHQDFGVWYPYHGRAQYCASLVAKTKMWRLEPEAISIWPGQDRDLQRFLEVCVFLVALCRTMSVDMTARCPAGKSFHHYTTAPLLQLLSAV